MDDAEAYKWGRIFCSERESLTISMAERAGALGLQQDVEDDALVWSRDGVETCRWVFVEEPSSVERVRAVFGNDRHVASPACFVVVRQDDPSDTRGDVIFDIFRLNAQSYLWHFNRVYTPPRQSAR